VNDVSGYSLPRMSSRLETDNAGRVPDQYLAAGPTITTGVRWAPISLQRYGNAPATNVAGEKPGPPTFRREPSLSV
jgi:hypothetical protein